MKNTIPFPGHKEPGYNHGHTMKQGIDPEVYAGTSLPYKAMSRIVNVLEDLHFQMQKPEGQRFIDYPVAEFEEVDTFIRDNMANLALSIETRELSERKTD